MVKMFIGIAFAVAGAGNTSCGACATYAVFNSDSGAALQRNTTDSPHADSNSITHHNTSIQCQGDHGTICTIMPARSLRLRH